MDGIKVLELGTLIAGPFCSRMLAEFGAGSDSRSTVVGVIDDMTETLSRISSSIPMETLVHQLDAGITWAIGVVRAFQDCCSRSTSTAAGSRTSA